MNDIIVLTIKVFSKINLATSASVLAFFHLFCFSFLNIDFPIYDLKLPYIQKTNKFTIRVWKNVHINRYFTSFFCACYRKFYTFLMTKKKSSNFVQLQNSKTYYQKRPTIFLKLFWHSLKK